MTEGSSCGRGVLHGRRTHPATSRRGCRYRSWSSALSRPHERPGCANNSPTVAHVRTGTDLPACGAGQRRADRHRPRGRQCGRRRHRGRRPPARPTAARHPAGGWPGAGCAYRFRAGGGPVAGYYRSAVGGRPAAAVGGLEDLARAARSGHSDHDTSATVGTGAKTMRSAVMQVAIADISMSLSIRPSVTCAYVSPLKICAANVKLLCT